MVWFLQPVHFKSKKMIFFLTKITFNQHTYCVSLGRSGKSLLVFALVRQGKVCVNTSNCVDPARYTKSLSSSSHLSLDREGRWGTTDDFATSFLHFSLLSTALWDLANFRPVHSLMLSSHLFLCLPCLLPPFIVPCKMVLASHDEPETWPYHCSLHLFMMVKRSSCGPIAHYYFCMFYMFLLI